MNYNVLWEIDIEADSPRKAAQIARDFQLDPDSTATFFCVSNDNGQYSIDLSDEIITDEQKIQIARDFVGQHRNSDVNNWFPFSRHDNDKWMSVYNSIIGGIYGECRLDDSDDFDEYEIEIRGSESSTGNPILFRFGADYD